MSMSNTEVLVIITLGEFWFQLHPSLPVWCWASYLVRRRVSLFTKNEKSRSYNSWLSWLLYAQTLSDNTESFSISNSFRISDFICFTVSGGSHDLFYTKCLVKNRTPNMRHAHRRHTQLLGLAFTKPFSRSGFWEHTVRRMICQW